MKIDLKNKKVAFGVAFVVLALLIPMTSATITYLTRGSFNRTIAAPDVIFKTGADTTGISGSITADGSTFSATGLPLVSGTQVTVDEAVKIRNNMTETPVWVKLSVYSESFDGECKAISIYVGGDLAISFGDDGSYSNLMSYTQLTGGSELTVKIVTEMDADVELTSESLVLHLEWLYAAP